jgi:hypothetical protein
MLRSIVEQRSSHFNKGNALQKKWIIRILIDLNIYDIIDKEIVN